jgi:hypothetical protein
VSEEKADGGQPARLIVMPEEYRHEYFNEIWDKTTGPAIKVANAPMMAEARPASPPRMLHFTSSAGLEAIVRSSSLRLSRARASNDPMELEYGLEIARSIIREGRSTDVVEKWFQKAIEAGTHDGRFGTREHRVPEPHVCCFAASAGQSDPMEESLAQWAMYGRNGAGFMLVFDGEALGHLPLVDFVPITYRPDEQRSRLETVIKIAKEASIGAYNLARPKGDETFAQYMLAASAHAFGSVLAMHAAAMKGSRHQIENEWRMLVSYIRTEPIGEQLEFGIESSGPLLRSHYVRSFPKEALRAVVVGAKHYELNEFVVSALLDKYDYKATNVVEGTVNIRGADGT